MRFQGFIAGLTLTVASLVAPAQAAPITYTLSGTISGSLGDLLFTNKALTWKMTSDTTLLQSIGRGLSGVPAAELTFGISGLGLIMPSQQIYLAVFDAPEIIFSDFNVSDGIEFGSPRFPGYDGITAIGPIPVSLIDSALLPTTLGVLIIDTASDLEFQASTVPEPVSLSLFAAGLAGAATMRRRAGRHDVAP